MNFYIYDVIVFDFYFFYIFSFLIFLGQASNSTKVIDNLYDNTVNFLIEQNEQKPISRMDEDGIFTIKMSKSNDEKYGIEWNTTSNRHGDKIISSIEKDSICDIVNTLVPQLHKVKEGDIIVSVISRGGKQMFVAIASVETRRKCIFLKCYKKIKNV